MLTRRSFLLHALCATLSAPRVGCCLAWRCVYLFVCALLPVCRACAARSVCLAPLFEWWYYCAANCAFFFSTQAVFVQKCHSAKRCKPSSPRSARTKLHRLTVSDVKRHSFFFCGGCSEIRSNDTPVVRETQLTAESAKVITSAMKDNKSVTAIHLSREFSSCRFFVSFFRFARHACISILQSIMSATKAR